MTENNSAISESLELATFIAQVIDDKQGQDIIVLPVVEVLAITEYFLVTSASNGRLFRAISDPVPDSVPDATVRGPLIVP